MSPSVFMDGAIFGRQRYGGISRMHFELVRHLAGTIPMRLFRGFSLDGYDWSGIALDRNIARPWSASFRGSARLRFYLERPWLEHGWSQAVKAGASIYHTSYYRVPYRRRKGKILVSDFDCIHERFPAFLYDAKAMMDLKRRAFEQADMVVSISESSKRDVMHFYDVPEEKLRVCHLGVDAFFDLPGHAVSRPGMRPYLLFVGSRAPYKNFELVERAAVLPELSEFDLIVVGGEAPLPDRHLPGGGCLRWERADDARLRELYWHASALIYPSLYEGFGLPPLEALASGCPVVASDIPVLHEVLAEHAEYFAADGPEALAAAVQRACTWDQTRRQAAYAHARSYSWQRTADAIRACYQELS